MKYNLCDSFFTDITLKYLLIILDQSEFIFSKIIFVKFANFQLAELRAEYGVLARTEEILKGKDETFQHQLVSVIVLGSTFFITFKSIPLKNRSTLL